MTKCLLNAEALRSKEKKQTEGSKRKGMQNIPGDEELTFRLAGLTGVGASQGVERRTDVMTQVSSRKGSARLARRAGFPGHLRPEEPSYPSAHVRRSSTRMHMA